MWRSVCRVAFRPESFIAFANLSLSRFGERGAPSQLANTRPSGGEPPSPAIAAAPAGPSSAPRSSDTTTGDKDIDRRPRADLGDLNRSPLLRVCSSDRSTCSLAPSRSTSCQRKAQSSPRRIPVPSATTAIGNSTRPRSASNIFGIWTELQGQGPRSPALWRVYQRDDVALDVAPFVAYRTHDAKACVRAALCAAQSSGAGRHKAYSDLRRESPAWACCRASAGHACVTARNSVRWFWADICCRPVTLPGVEAVIQRLPVMLHIRTIFHFGNQPRALGLAPRFVPAKLCHLRLRLPVFASCKSMTIAQWPDERSRNAPSFVKSSS